MKKETQLYWWARSELKKITARVGPNGRIVLEFTGFIGEECMEERQRFAKTLVEFGLMLDTEKLERKNARQIALETSMDEQGRTSRTSMRT
jgi:acetate kinase